MSGTVGSQATLSVFITLRGEQVRDEAGIAATSRKTQNEREAI
jgi:hypothetical protein